MASNNGNGKVKVAVPAAGAAQQFSLQNFLISFRLQAGVLAVLAFILYANTFSHETAFDDRMAITANEYVQRGIAGIPDILTHDAYQSYLEQRGGGNQLAGGRYRPLSLISFAVEQQLLGVIDESISGDEREEVIAGQMHARHVVNVLLYILAALALLYLFHHYFFPGHLAVAFVAALLFVIHPVHTEVVANVKSRDEIMSVLFIALSFIALFRYVDRGGLGNIIRCAVFVFLALLSKEYAITLIVLLPLSLYTVRRATLAESIRPVLPCLAAFALYALLRFASVTGPAEGAENSIMNNPYLLATPAQALASKLFVLLLYIKLLFVPHPLAADYSYAQLPYTSFSDPLVWCSVIVYAAIVVLCIICISKRQVIGLALAIYLLPLMLVSNLVVNIGAPLGERLIFHSSIGFAMAVAYVLVQGAARLGSQVVSRWGLGAGLLVVTVLSTYKTIARNADWKNDNTLFLHDVATVPNSALVNNNAAAACMAYAKQARGDRPVMQQWFTHAIGYFDKAIALNPGYINARLNRGLCYFNMGDPDKAFPDWDTVRKMEPANPKAAQYLDAMGKYYFNEGMRLGRANKPDSAAMAFRKGTMATPAAADMWYNLAYAQYSAGNMDAAKQALEQTLKLEPNKASAMQLYHAINSSQSK